MDYLYSLIKIKNKTGKIEVYFINMNNNQKSNIYPLCFTAYNVNSIFLLLSLHDILLSLSVLHTLYLGKELFKAEISLIIGQQYIQD